MRYALTVLLLALGLSGCAVYPAYVDPRFEPVYYGRAPVYGYVAPVPYYYTPIPLPPPAGLYYSPYCVQCTPYPYNPKYYRAPR